MVVLTRIDNDHPLRRHGVIITISYRQANRKTRKPTINTAPVQEKPTPGAKERPAAPIAPSGYANSLSSDDRPHKHHDLTGKMYRHDAVESGSRMSHKSLVPECLTIRNANSRAQAGVNNRTQSAKPVHTASRKFAPFSKARTPLPPAREREMWTGGMFRDYYLEK